VVVEGKPKNDQQILVNFLKKDEQKNKVEVFDKEVPGSQQAELFYKVLRSNKKHSLLEVELKTGRPHQIRAQLSHIKCPIVGDIKYGPSFVDFQLTIA
jgi:23S rRNA pseudouridine1911/1915/1917 synthase